jgi:class 3 adenylate cyclase/predicted ATPase
MRFCGRCAAPLKLACERCGFANPADFEFCGQCAGPLSAAAKPAPAPTTQSPQAERRQLTVLFCDMVGSSSLSEQLDPEELRDIMRDYRATCSEVVARYEGHVAQYLGDGILVYFGYPHAHEDDARRAVQASLEITRRIPQLCYPAPSNQELCLAVRVGVHTGLVVVGAIGDGDKRSLALGDTPNISARLQSLAETNSVIISDATRRLVQDHFDCDALGEQQLKGFSQSMPIHKVRQERSRQRPRTARGSGHHAPLIGRDQESQLLQERLEQARRGVGQIVMLSGEAGLGKTRLVQRACEQLAGEACLILECAGSPYYQNSFLFPIIELGQRLLSIDDSDSGPQKTARLEKAIATLGLDTAKIVPLIAELLSFPILGGDTAAASTPQQKKRRIFDALLDILRVMSEQRLVLLVVEDLQWIDASTLELLGQLIEQPGLNNLFAIFTFRNEFSPAWNSRGNLTRINLNKLTRAQTGSMIRHLCQGKTLPLEVFDEIVNKTDGIPYFVEELTGMVLNSNLLRERADHFELVSSMAELAIPSTLQDSLMSRLDGLGEDKELAQLSATLGREFAHELLAAVSQRSDQSLQQGLNRLLNADLFFQRGQPPKAQYGFRQALLREAAYQSLLKRTRQQYHRRIAELLAAQFPDTVAANPELMAYHCGEGGNLREAVDHWLAAGRYALKRSANIEAATHLRQGLAALRQLPDSAPHRTLELALQTSLGLAVMMNKGYAALEVEQAYERARALCEGLGDASVVYPVLCGLWEFYVVRADLQSAAALAQQVHDLSSQCNDAARKRESQRIQGTTLFWQGRLSEALGLLANEADTERRQTDAIPYCQDSQVAALANAGCILFLLGKPDQALASARQALELAKSLAHPFSQAYASHFLAVVHQLRGDTEAMLRQAETGIALGDTYGFAFWSATGKMLRAWALSVDDNPNDEKPRDENLEPHIAAFREGLDAYEACGSRLARSYFLSLLADLYLRAQRFDETLATVDIALRETATTGEQFFVAELLRQKGAALAQVPDTDLAQAEEILNRALQMAKQQSSDSLALRTAIDMARIRPDRGDLTPAITLLEQRLAKIGEGHDTKDVKTASMLLAALSKKSAQGSSGPSQGKTSP